MSNLDETLAARGTTHGDFTQNSRTSQDLKQIMRLTPNWLKLTPYQQEALDMTCHKMGRIGAGDPNEPDHWRDVAGYNKLVEDRLTPAIHGNTLTPQSEGIHVAGGYPPIDNDDDDANDALLTHQNELLQGIKDNLLLLILIVIILLGTLTSFTIANEFYKHRQQKAPHKIEARISTPSGEIIGFGLETQTVQRGTTRVNPVFNDAPTIDAPRWDTTPFLVTPRDN